LVLKVKLPQLVLKRVVKPLQLVKLLVLQKLLLTFLLTTTSCRQASPVPMSCRAAS
jgi:hypothetical protein